MNRRELLTSGAAGLGVASLGFLALPRSARAQGKYPDHAIRLIVPRPGGGVVDVVAREWGDKVTKTLGTSYVENQGGGGGVIGAQVAARAAPDGYSLFFGTTSEMVLNPLIAKQTYDPIKDFVPIAIMSISVGAIVVNASVPVTNLKELIAYAKANPGKLVYGSAGAGSTSNLTGELFKHLAGLPDITHIPYKGANPGITDLVAGQIPIMTPMVSGNIMDLHRAGKVRVLAAASEKRIAAASDIPTGAEQGFPGLVSQLFVGLFAPTGTPQPILDQIYRATHDAMADKDLQKKMVDAAFDPVIDSTPDKAAHFLQEDIARWTPVLAQSGMKPG